jgi:hypothetical protein
LLSNKTDLTLRYQADHLSSSRRASFFVNALGHVLSYSRIVSVRYRRAVLLLDFWTFGTHREIIGLQGLLDVRVVPPVSHHSYHVIQEIAS